MLVANLTLSRNIVTIDVTTTSVINRKHNSRMYCRQTKHNVLYLVLYGKT